jgi:hypothetical protein
VKRAMHRLRHLFGLNNGSTYSWWDSDTNHLMIGFRCDGCATIEHVEQRPHVRQRENAAQHKEPQ